jgi:hypothetical protein
MWRAAHGFDGVALRFTHPTTMCGAAQNTHDFQRSLTVFLSITAH